MGSVHFFPITYYFQALASNTLQEVSIKKDNIVNELYEVLDYGEQQIQAENNEIDLMADIRGARQKSVLLEKVSCYMPIAT